MLSVRQKLSLQSYLLWGILAGTAFAACTWLGFAPITALLMAGSLGLSEMSAYFGYTNTTVASFWALTTLLFTFNIATVAFVFMTNLFAFEYDKRPESLIDDFSTYRKLNKMEPKERWLLNAIKQLSNRAGIVVNTIFYRDFLSLFKVPNKYRQNSNSNTQEKLIKKLINIKNFSSPSLSAASRSNGNFVIVDSNVFDANKKITRKEIVAVLAHEIGHIVNRDSFKRGLHQGLYWITVILGVCSLSLWGLGLALAAHLAWYRLQQTKELMADAYSAQLTDPKDLIGFFKKSSLLEKKLSEKLSINKTYVNAWERWCSTHPDDEARIKMLEQIQQEKSASPTPTK